MDRSESPARNGLTQIFSKSRRDKRSKDSSTTSLNSNHSGGLQSSLEDTIDKLKGHDASDEDEEVSGIKKLVPKVLGSKRRRKKQEKEEEQQASEEIARGRTVADRGTLGDNPEPSLSPYARSTGDGDSSSLITVDSDNES